MSHPLLWFLLCFISHGVCIQIQISKGKVEGEEVEVNGEVVNVFKSIPYAEPPIDDLRFRRPFEVGDWDGVFDSNEYMSPCPNGFNPESAKNISEDCLYLSVFADQKCLNTSCPVVFFVHDLIGQPMSSGDFSELEVAQKFAYDGIVFVRPNYRMGLLGFLDLGEDLDEAPYNVGLHDLRLALQFVNREIRAFGGDPNRITIFGSSYGADLSVLLLNSPKFREIPISQGILFSAMPSIGGGHSLNATKKVLELLKVNWTTSDWHGAGYYLFDFPRPTENATDFVGGIMINDSYFNEPAIKFWLNDLAIEEASESEEEETKIIPPPAENDDNDDQNEEDNRETSESSANSVKATTKFGHIGAYSDTKTLAERELEVETVWMLFSIILVAAIALALLVIVLCLCLLKEKRGRRRVYRPSPVKFIQS
uniref:COesterase domain-containing protein n=1 Tax=Bursaphelenchus xylophilus TaxID=6326 RepID=A0A1I7SCR1_BURXY